MITLVSHPGARAVIGFGPKKFARMPDDAQLLFRHLHRPDYRMDGDSTVYAWLDGRLWVGRAIEAVLGDVQRDGDTVLFDGVLPGESYDCRRDIEFLFGDDLLWSTVVNQNSLPMIHRYRPSYWDGVEDAFELVDISVIDGALVQRLTHQAVEKTAAYLPVWSGTDGLVDILDEDRCRELIDPAVIFAERYAAATKRAHQYADKFRGLADDLDALADGTSDRRPYLFESGMRSVVDGVASSRLLAETYADLER